MSVAGRAQGEWRDSSHHRVLPTGFVALATCLVFEVASAQPPSNPVEWPQGVRISQSERQEILALAKIMGVAEPVKVSIGVVLALGDRFVTVDGRVSSNGPQRSWATARMFRENWRDPDNAPAPEQRTHRVGRWISMGDGEHVSLWRMEAAWFVEVTLDAGVSYTDAQRIVLALRRGTFATRPDNPPPCCVPERFEPSAGTTIQRTGNDRYSLRWPTSDYTGYVIEVVVSGANIELISISFYEI